MNVTTPAVRAAALDQTAHGHLDAVDPEGGVRGWCAAEAEPFGPRSVTVLVDGKPALTGIICDLYRKDLLAAGIGDGHHGFAADLPRALLRAGEQSEISLIDEASGLPVGQVITQVWREPAGPKPVLEAHVDQITAEGMISGWCWDRANPDRRITLNIMVDGVLTGSVLAGIYRDDLRQAGKGTGHCGFGYFLPWQLITARGEVAVTLQDAATGLPVGRRMTLQSPHLITAEQRIDGLERQLRLLRAELQAAEARAAHADMTRSQPDLFRVVAAFFQELAEGRPPARLVSLKARLDDVAERLPIIPLSLAANPDVTLYVLPDGVLSHLHACLQAIHRSGADARARVVILDAAEDGHDDATLIQAVARNVTVLRRRPDETLGGLLSATPTRYLAVIAAHIVIRPGWLEGLTETLDRDPAVAIAATGFGGDDGAVMPQHVVIDPRTGLFVPPRAAVSSVDGVMQVDALDELAMLIRLETLQGVGGLDPSFSGLPAQLLDFCLRARQLGCFIASRLEAGAELCADRRSLLDQTVASDIDRLRARASALR